MLKPFAKFLFAVLLIVVSISLIVEMKYSISLTEYLAYSVPLTREEKQYLQEKETLVYGIDPEAAPFSFVNGETGQIEGLVADYMSILALDLGMDIQSKVVEPSEILESLKTREIDMTDLFVDTGEKNQYVSTQPLYELTGIMVTRYGNREISAYRDMQGKRLAMVEGDFLELRVLKAFPQGQSMNIVYTDSVKKGLELLMEDQVEALVANETVIDFYAEEMDIESDLRQVGDAVYKEDVTLAVNVYDTKLYNILNKEILNLKKRNVFIEAQEKWLGTSAPIVTDSTSVKWAQWIILFCVGTVVILMLWESVLNRRIEQKTREIRIEKNNLQVVIDNIDALIAVINGDDVITQCNDYGKRLLQDTAGSFVGCGLGTTGMLKDLYDMYGKNPDAPYYIYKERYYSVFVRVLNGSRGNRLMMVEDCTGTQMAERKLRQESKMIAVGQLSAGLAHEIRNPLGLIKNYSYLLRDYATDDMAGHSLDVIGDSAKRIDQLVENLLRFSRLSNDKTEMLNVEKLLRSILDLEQKKLEKQKVTLSLVCAKDLTLYMCEETVKIIAFNLINNAVEAFREADMSEGRLKVGAKCEEGVFYLKVEDNGPGMPQTVVEHIFNPFFTTKDTGTGLGLYIVNSELEKVNGQITVDSRPGEGSAFTVKIPVREQTDEDK